MHTMSGRAGAALAQGIGWAALIGLLALPSHARAAEAGTSPGGGGTADAGIASASSEVRYVAQWAVASRDNGGMPYIIVDKVNARVFVFDAGGHLEGSAPALLGMTKGDRSPAGIGNEKVAAIAPAQRITPAGRFVASQGRSLHGGQILWIDYATALALHPVVPGTLLERRAQRLASASSEDNRISYGCINVPPKFYGSFVSPAFAHSNGIVYILPEQSAARDMFRPPGDDAGTPAAAPVNSSPMP